MGRDEAPSERCVSTDREREEEMARGRAHVLSGIVEEMREQTRLERSTRPATRADRYHSRRTTRGLSESCFRVFFELSRKYSSVVVVLCTAGVTS